ncbi:hypothetical protein Lal_00020163 [Lupinus albus]|nr:hypothetical protein Lal_00020163 [Lupinus albus]
MEARGVTVGFPGDGRREVEGLSPTPLVDVGNKIIEGVDEVGDLVGGFDLLGAAKEGPVVIVVVLDFIGRDGATREIGGAFALLFGGAENADEPVEAAGEESGSAKEREEVHFDTRYDGRYRVFVIFGWGF